MNSSNTSDDVDKTITETNTEQSLLTHENSNEEQNILNPKENTVVRDDTNKTETPELETHDSSTITYNVPNINDCEPAFNSNENLSNDNSPTSEDLNNERSSIGNDNGIEDFLMSIEEHHVPELRWSWETHFSNVPQIIIDADANNQYDHHLLDEAELNSFVNTRTLHNIIEENYNEHTAEEYNYHLLSRNRNHTFIRGTRVTEVDVPHSSTSNSSNQNLNIELRQNQTYNENHSLVPSFIYNHPRARQLFNNLGVRLVNRNIIVPFSNNLEVRNNVLLNFNYNNEVNNIIYVTELNIYRNSMLNALANENNLMEELYQANRRLNEIHDQEMLAEHTDEPVNEVADAIEEIEPIDNIEVQPNNLLPIQEQAPVQPQQLPFEQLILIANGGITPLNGQYNALIRLIDCNPNLVFLNIRNIILIVHPHVLVGGNNVVFGQNHHWVSVRELLRMNPVILNYESRNNNNGNQEFNREAGPSNEGQRNR